MVLGFFACRTERKVERRPGPPSYTYGTEIRFGEGGSETPYLKDGWSIPEKGFRWTESRRASLLMGVAAPPRDLVLSATFAMALTVPGELERQRVVVGANGQALSEWTVTKAGSKQVTIPRTLVTNGSLAITFDLPDATVPAAVTPSSDGRQLGVAFYAVSIALQ